MNEEAKQLVRRLLEEGKRYDEVRVELISNGYNTDKFEEEYHEIQKVLGIKETPPTKGVHQAPYMSYENIEDAKPIRKSNVVTNIFMIISGILTIIVAVIIFSEYGTSIKNVFYSDETGIVQDGLSPIDIAHEAQIRGMQKSADIYKAKLTDYGGVCKSIGIDRAIYNCKDNPDSYLIEVPLSNGQYYCVDNTDFSGTVSNSRVVDFSSCI